MKVALPLLWTLLLGCAHGPAKPPDAPPSQVRADALFQHGVSAAHAGDLVRAEQYLTLARRAGYPDAEVLPWLLELCISASRYRAALAYAESYLDEHPNDQALFALVRSLREALGQAQESGPQNAIQRTWPVPRPIGATGSMNQKETDHDSGGDTPPQPDAIAPPGDTPVGGPERERSADQRPG